jgi:hypothetical protein
MMSWRHHRDYPPYVRYHKSHRNDGVHMRIIGPKSRAMAVARVDRTGARPPLARPVAHRTMGAAGPANAWLRLECVMHIHQRAFKPAMRGAE